MQHTSTCEPYAAAVTALADGRMDSLTPEQVDAVAQHLNECPACAGRLADVSSTLPLPTSLAVADPPAQAWALLWEAIDRREHAMSSARDEARGVWPFRRFVQTFSAVAAALLVGLGVWQFTRPSEPAARGIYELAHAGDVTIESLEVSGDDTSFVVTADDDVQVIWVVEDQGA